MQMMLDAVANYPPSVPPSVIRDKERIHSEFEARSRGEEGRIGFKTN